MVAQLNTKYNQAIIDSKKCLSLSESISLHKVPEAISDLTKLIKDAISIEYPENYFTSKNLLNSNYNDITFRDLEKYLYLSEQFGYKDSGKDMLKSILNDNDKGIETPILIKGKNNIYWQLTGNLQMMAFKVLGIFPVVREIPINANITP